MKITFIDHYDSFSANLQDWLLTADFPVELDIVPFDNVAGMAAVGEGRVPLMLSPGPKRPEDAAATLEVVQRNLGKVPIFGVCLGHQILGVQAGGRVLPSVNPQHGECKRVCFSDRRGLFAGMALWGEMASYNSLIVTRESDFSADWVVTARSDEGEIVGLEYRPCGKTWAYGVQFHPESFLSRKSEIIRHNWLQAVAAWYSESA